jgi:hypothetical protein
MINFGNWEAHVQVLLGFEEVFEAGIITPAYVRGTFNQIYLHVRYV